jgi:hypothetical protein
MSEVLENQVEGEEVEGQDEEVEETTEGGRKLTTSKAKKAVNGETRHSTVYLDLGGNLQEASARFGEAVVFDLYRRSAVIKAQAQQRAMIEAGKTDTEINSFFTNWNPSVKASVPKDPKAEIARNFQGLTPEEKRKMLADLRASLNEE